MTYPKAGVRIDTFRMDYELHGAPAKTVGYHIIEPKPVVEIEVDPNESSVEGFYYQILHDTLDFAIEVDRGSLPHNDWEILPHISTMDIWEMWKFVGVSEYLSGEMIDEHDPPNIEGNTDDLEILVDRLTDILQGAGYFVSNTGSRFAVYKFDPYHDDGNAEVAIISQFGDQWVLKGGPVEFAYPSFSAAVTGYAKNAAKDEFWCDLFYENNGSYYCLLLFGDWTEIP